jgi:hypothetical protein
VAPEAATVVAPEAATVKGMVEGMAKVMEAGEKAVEGKEG